MPWAMEPDGLERDDYRVPLLAEDVTELIAWVNAKRDQPLVAVKRLECHYRT